MAAHRDNFLAWKWYLDAELLETDLKEFASWDKGWIEVPE